MCQIYSRLVIDTLEQHQVLLLTLTYFALYSLVNIAEFEQINAGWA